MTILPTLLPNSVHLVLADLPYGTTACKWDTLLPLGELWYEYRRVLRADGAVILTASQPFTSALVMSNPAQFKHGWVWNKRFAGNFATAKYAPMKIHEDVLVFSNGRVPYRPQMIARDTPIKLGGNRCGSDSAKIAQSKREYEGKVYTEKFPESILLFSSRDTGNRGLHPTQKPVALMEYLIRTYTNPGDTVLDNCMGSGTTGVACVNTGRGFIGIEKGADYFAIAEKRIADAVSQNALDLGGAA